MTPDSNISAPASPGNAAADAIGSGLRLLRWIMLFAVAAYLLVSCFVIVDQHEVAIALRFGRPAADPEKRILPPGLHFALPYPFDEVVRVPARRILTVGTATFWPASKTETQEALPAETACTITGDANILNSRWDARVAITDPEAFAFACRDVEGAVACELDRAVIQASAGFRVDDILRSDEAFRDAVALRLAERLRALGLGLTLERADLLELSPPKAVAPAFDAVLQAEQEMSTAVNAAEAEAGAIVTAAEGQAARIISLAQADATRFLSRIEADASYFSRLAPEFEKAPETLSATLLQEVWARAVLRAEGRYILRSGAGAEREQELRILLSPEPATARPMRSSKAATD